MCSSHRGGRKTRARTREVALPLSTPLLFRCASGLVPLATWLLVAGVSAWVRCRRLVRGVRCRMLVVRVRVERVLGCLPGCGGPSFPRLAAVWVRGRAARRAERRRLGERGPAHPIGMRA